MFLHLIKSALSGLTWGDLALLGASFLSLLSSL